MTLFLLALTCISAAAVQPDLALRDTQGRPHSLADYRGKIVLLNFWATWCVPCKEEMQIFSEINRRYRDRGVVVLAASVDSAGTKKFIPQFAKSHGMDFPVLVDASTDTMKQVGLGESIPSTLLIDADGNVAGKILGQARKKDVMRRVEWLLGNRKGKAPAPVTNNLGKRK